MAAITSAGIGSGLDVDKIITSITQAERAPLTKLQNRASAIQAKISTYGQIRSLLGELNSASRELWLDRGWNGTKINASASHVVATSTGQPQVGNYSIDVKQMASGQTGSTSASVGESEMMGTGGVIRIKGGVLGANGYDINVSGGFTLTQIVTTINNTSGLSDHVQASTVAGDDGKQRLVLRSRATGSDKAFSVEFGSGVTGGQLDAIDPAASSNFAKLAQGGFNVTQQAKNANILFNGVEVSSSTNVFDKVIAGVNLTVASVGTSNISVTADKDVTRNNIQKFVDAYNNLNKLLSQATKFEEDEKTKQKTVGPLQGDSATVSLQNSLRMLTQGIVTNATGGLKRLSDVGIEMQRGGTLSLNTSKLNAALDKPEQLKAVFAARDDVTGQGGGIATKFKAMTDKMLSLSGTLDKKDEALQAELNLNSREQARVEQRASSVAKRMRAQYTALDSKMGRINSINSYVTQMVNAWNKSKG